VIAVYGILLAVVQIPMFSDPTAIAFQVGKLIHLIQYHFSSLKVTILLLNSVPCFLFVCVLSHLFNRALTLTAYVVVLLTGVVPFMIADLVLWNRKVFEVVHFLFTFTCPTYIPFGMSLHIFHAYSTLGRHQYHSSTMGMFYVACVAHLLWAVPLWFLDRYINGIPLCKV